LPSADRHGQVNCNFGAFFDWLISEAGALYNLLLTIPILVLSDEVYDFMAENHSEMTVETAVEKEY
jgi:hypothetical protein